MRVVCCWAAALLLSASASNLDGQTPYRVPDSPAFSYLSATPTDVSHPTTARAFTSSVATVVDSAGQLRQGFALEAAPWSWLPGVSIPVDQYDRIDKYMLANATLSLGTVAAGGTDGDTDLAVGLRTTIFDQADPMRDAEFRQALRDIDCGGGNAEADPTQIEVCQGNAIERLRSEWLEGQWNASSVAVAAVSGWSFGESQLNDGEWSGWAAWVSGALGVGSIAQLLVQAGYDSRESPDTLPDMSGLRGGSRLVMGSDLVNGFLEFTFARSLDDDTADKTTGKWSSGVEFRAASDLWISTGFGSGFSTEGTDRVVLLANLRWRIAEQPALAP